MAYGETTGDWGGGLKTDNGGFWSGGQHLGIWREVTADHGSVIPQYGDFEFREV